MKGNPNISDTSYNFEKKLMNKHFPLPYEEQHKSFQLPLKWSL